MALEEGRGDATASDSEAALGSPGVLFHVCNRSCSAHPASAADHLRARGGSPGELPAPGHTSIMDAAKQGMGQMPEPLPHPELSGEQAEQLTGGVLPLQRRCFGLEADLGCGCMHAFWAGVILAHSAPPPLQHLPQKKCFP